MATKKAVKSAIRERLLGETLVGQQVYVDRIGPLQENQLPGIVIFVAAEELEFVDNTQDRVRLKVAIEIQTKENQSAADYDEISDQVYAILRNHEYLGDLVEHFRYVRGELLYDERRHVDGGAYVMEYEARYLIDTTPDLDVANPADLVTIEADTQAGQEPDPEDNPILGSHIALPQ